MDRKEKATAPLEILLEEMIQPNFSESRVKSSTAMKIQGARVRLMLIQIKSLIAGECSNNRIDSPSNLLILFVGANNQTEDDKNVRLSLCLLGGKVLSEETASDLMKKGH